MIFMNYIEQTKQLLEFDKVIELIKSMCYSDVACEKLDNSLPLSNRRTIEVNFKRLAEFNSLQKQDQNLSIHTILNCHLFLAKIHIENFFIELEDLHALRNMSNNVREIKEFFKKTSNPEEFANLIDFSNSIFYDNAIERAINKVVTEHGELKTDASPELKRIRMQKATMNATINNAFSGVLSQSKSNGYLNEIGESIRNGRRVLAVNAENKRSIKGIIHDESETGKIVYIEPSETIFLNNEAFEIERQEWREIRRILIETTKFLSQYKSLIHSYQEFMVEWDIIQAKNKFSNLIGGSIPEISNKIVLRNAFHPLLKIKNLKDKKAIVPFHLDLGNQKMLMISGPNAGGKSITMKTIGLIAMMVRASIPIAAEGQSIFPLFHTVLGDIGDLQSLQDELSTYSSKLKLWKEMMSLCDKDTLLLFDELGNGTDPSFGAAMAQSVIESCLQKSPTIIATTHYSDLKKLADERLDILNGSMLFDEVKLEPIYKLILDKPGSSYTFHIARKSGLNHDTIKRAEKLSDTEQFRYDKQLLKLERKEKELHLRHKELEASERELKKQMKDWNRLHLDLDLTRKKVKYEKLLHTQEVEIEKVRELKDYKNKLKEIDKEKLEAEQKVLAEKIEKSKEESKVLYKAIHKVNADYHFKEGDTVQYIQTNTKGIIDKIQKNKAIVIFDHIKSTLALADLIPVSEVEKKRVITKKMFTSESIPQRELDLRGKFVYEAIPELEDFINKALMNNFYEIKIIHGKGKLKTEIQKSLKGFKSISKIAHAQPEHGGDGVSYVYF